MSDLHLWQAFAAAWAAIAIIEHVLHELTVRRLFKLVHRAIEVVENMPMEIVAAPATTGQGDRAA